MVVMTSVMVVVATPVKTDRRSDGGGDERSGTGEMAMVVVVTNDGGVVTSGRRFFSFLYELRLFSFLYALSPLPLPLVSPSSTLGFRQKKAINQSLHKTLIGSPRLSQKINLEKPMPSTSLANGSVNGNAGDRPPDAVADDKPGVSMMEQLVPEITTHALSYLDYPSLCRLSMTNSLMRKAANDDNAWKALFHKDFTLEQDGITPVNGWKAYYATTRAIISVNTGFFDIIRERSLPEMAQLWLNSDYVKCIHASGELFSGYSEVMQSWQLCFNWEQGFDFQVHNVRTRILTDMAWVTMKAYLNVDAGPFLITNVFEHHNGRWHMVHHHSSVMLIDGVNQQVVVH